MSFFKTALLAGATKVALGIAMIPVAAAAVDPVAFQQGLADRATWEGWFAQQTGDAKVGASWWVGQRSLPNSGNCDFFPAHVIGFGGQLDSHAGCLAAKWKLAPFDAKRLSDPDYKRGWNAWVANTATPPTAAKETATPTYVPPPAPTQQVLVGEQAPGVQPGQTMQFRLVIDTDQYGTWEWVSAQGPITKQTPNDFLAFDVSPGNSSRYK